jgi:hypothetical protein
MSKSGFSCIKPPRQPFDPPIREHDIGVGRGRLGSLAKHWKRLGKASRVSKRQGETSQGERGRSKSRLCGESPSMVSCCTLQRLHAHPAAQV